MNQMVLLILLFIIMKNINQTKDKGAERKKESKPKERRAYIVWEDNDNSTIGS